MNCEGYSLSTSALCTVQHRSKSHDAVANIAGITGIGCHNLSPGMVLTNLLLEDASTVAKRFFNALAEEPETVAAALVPQIRTIQVPALANLAISQLIRC